MRRAVPEDAAALADVWLASRRSAPGIPAAVHDDADVRRWVREELLPRREVLVSTADGAVVALLALDGERIDQLYVAPAHQRRGHGSRLLAAAQSGRRSLTLWTFAANEGARAFYEAHGFRPDGEPSSENEEGAPALLYRWRRPR